MKTKKELESHLKHLRLSYLQASPAQRIKIAKQRTELPDSAPNILIAHVSAVEGVLRSILIEKYRKTFNLSLEDAYDWLKEKNGQALVELYCKNHKVSRTSLIPKKTWSNLEMAIAYRNFLIHECAFLSEGICSQLVGACKEVHTIFDSQPPS